MARSPNARWRMGSVHLGGGDVRVSNEPHIAIAAQSADRLSGTKRYIELDSNAGSRRKG